MYIGSNKLLVDQSMAADFTSDTIVIMSKEGYAIHAVFTGSPVGELVVQASINNSDWNDIPATLYSVTAAGDVLWNITQANYTYARLKYTKTSGTGTLNAFVSTREED